MVRYTSQVLTPPSRCECTHIRIDHRGGTVCGQRGCPCVEFTRSTPAWNSEPLTADDRVTEAVRIMYELEGTTPIMARTIILAAAPWSRRMELVGLITAEWRRLDQS